jgi:hypothetical protein
MIIRGRVDLILFEDLAMLPNRKCDELYVEIAKHYAAIGDLTNLDELIRRVNDPNSIDLIWIEFVQRCAETCDWKEARNYMERIAKIEHKDKAFTILGDALVAAGFYTEATDVFESIHSELTRDESLQKIIRNCVNEEQFSTALEVGKAIYARQVYSKAWEELGMNSIKQSKHELNWKLLFYFKSHGLSDLICLGMVKELDLFAVSENTAMKTLAIYYKDMNIMKLSLEKFFLRSVFEGTIPKSNYADFDKTLNLQWAIDIKNQLPNSYI